MEMNWFEPLKFLLVVPLAIVTAIATFVLLMLMAFAAQAMMRAWEWPGLALVFGAKRVDDYWKQHFEPKPKPPAAAVRRPTSSLAASGQARQARQARQAPERVVVKEPPLESKGRP